MRISKIRVICYFVICHIRSADSALAPRYSANGAHAHNVIACGFGAFSQPHPICVTQSLSCRPPADQHHGMGPTGGMVGSDSLRTELRVKGRRGGLPWARN
jgi:hypothetical protein